VIYSANSAVKMAAHKKRVLSESEMKRILEDSGSEFDNVFSENENSSKSESETESEENVDESAEESSDSSDSDDNTASQA
jgi:arsenate reductase-like glutaredoxin family protein